MPAWTPADLAVPPAIWFSARRSTITQSSGVVSAVSNLGSVGGSFATVSTRAPTYVATGWDGVLPSLNFNDDAMLLSASHTGNQMSTFVVSEETGDSVSSILSFRTPSQAGWQNIGNMNFGRSYFQARYMLSRNVNDVFWAVPFRTKNIAAALWNSAGMTAFTNGASTPVVDGSGNPTSTSGMAGNFGFTQVYLGDGAASTDGPFTGKVPEAVVLNYQPTSSEREQIEGYLAWEWGIQALLPSGHPYRNAAPQTGGGGTTTNQTVSVTSTGAVAIRRMVGKRLAVAASGAVSVLRVRALLRTVSVASTGAVSILRRLSLNRVVSVASAAAVLVRKAISKQVSVASASTVLVNAVKTAGAAIVYQTVAVIASSSVAVSRSIGKRVAVSATGAVSVRKAIGKTVAVVSNSAVQVAKGLAVRITVAAASAVSVTAGRLYRQTVNVLGSSSVMAMASKVIFTFGQRVVRLLPMMRLAATDSQNRAAAVDMENRTVAVLSDGNNAAAPED